MEAELGSPLGEGHAEVGAAEAAEGAFGGDAFTEVGEGAVVGRVLVQDRADRGEAWIAGRRQVGRALRGVPELVEQYGAEAVAFRRLGLDGGIRLGGIRLVQGAGDGFVVPAVGVGEDELAQE